MSDQVKISFDDDGTLVIDTEGLDERLREKLFQRGNIVREGDKVKVQTLGPLPWDATIPADGDCGCGHEVIPGGEIFPGSSFSVLVMGPSAEQEEAVIPRFDLSQTLAANLLELIVMPTEQCNFRCTYCYEDFALGRMEPGTVRGLLRLMTRRAPKLDRLEISWFGGEPLLAADIVEEVQSHARDLTALHPRLAVSGSMTTNGFLLDRDQLLRLLGLGVRSYQISLDGPREHHDRKRVRIGGQPTFDRIWGNLEAARELDGVFEIMIRIHVDQNNVDVIPTLLERCAESFGADGRFKVFVRPLSRLGGPHDAALSILDGAEGARAIDALRCRAQELGLATYERGSALDVCYASKANSFVVRSDGTLGKCTVALSNPRNRVGRLFEDGHVEIESEAMQGWMRGLWSGDAEELRCPMEGFADPAMASSVALLQIGGHPGVTA